MAISLSRARQAGLFAMAAILSVAMTGSAVAQKQTSNPASVERMFECREISDPDQRLACFDREVSAVFDAQASRDLVIAERAEVTETRRNLFGLQVPDSRLLGDGDEIDSITSVLARANRLQNGRYIFELQDGARWIQTENSAGFRRYEAGDTIVIEKAALGSFKAKVDGGRAIRVRRLN